MVFLGRCCVVVFALALVAACRAQKKPRAPEAPRQAHYRPLWLSSIEASMDSITRCVSGRESPTYVLHVHHTADALTVVSTVDAYEAVERCVVDASAVRLREPSDKRLSDFAGHPVFSVGPQAPSVPVGAQVDELTSGGQCLGWVFWPQVSDVDRDDRRTADVSTAEEEELREE
jgi:hypothetical protein